MVSVCCPEEWQNNQSFQKCPWASCFITWAITCPTTDWIPAEVVNEREHIWRVCIAKITQGHPPTPWRRNSCLAKRPENHNFSVPLKYWCPETVQINYQLFLFLNFSFAIFPFLLHPLDSHNSISRFLAHFQNEWFLRICIFWPVWVTM